MVSGKAAGHKGWSKADDERLKSVMNSSHNTSWLEIAQAAFPDGSRDLNACCDRWTHLQKPKSTKGPWLPHEDAVLCNLVNEMGPEKWVQIADRLGSRSGKQCRERWHNHLDPNIKKTPFSPEEDAIIFELYSKIGSKWAEMARHLPGRPDNAIKNHFNTSLQRSKRRNSTASSVSSAAGADIVTSPTAVGNRYSPYRSRRRQGSVASSTKTVPPSPSPLTPHAVPSRSTSPEEVRSPNSRKPNFHLNLGRNLDKEYFSPSRNSSALGFASNGPVTAPAEYAADRFTWSSSEMPADLQFVPLDPDTTIQSADMHSTLSDSPYRYMRHELASQLPPAAYEPSDVESSALVHSYSTSSIQTTSSSSSSPGTPSPGLHNSMVQPYIATEFDSFAHRFSLPGAHGAQQSPPRPASLQRTNSLPCYPSTPPADPRSVYPLYGDLAHQYLQQKSLGIEVNYSPLRGSSYFADSEGAIGDLYGSSPTNFLQQRLSGDVDLARQTIGRVRTESHSSISSAGSLSIEDIPGFGDYQHSLSALDRRIPDGLETVKVRQEENFGSPGGSPCTASSRDSEKSVSPQASPLHMMRNPLGISSPASATFIHASKDLANALPSLGPVSMDYLIQGPPPLQQHHFIHGATGDAEAEFANRSLSMSYPGHLTSPPRLVHPQSHRAHAPHFHQYDDFTSPSSSFEQHEQHRLSI